MVLPSTWFYPTNELSIHILNTQNHLGILGESLRGFFKSLI
eukprot:UN11314